MHPVVPTQSEFRIEQSGLRFANGALRYAWFRLADREQGGRVRAVCLRELTYLPIETRADPDLLGKQWAALRGLYNAGVDFLYSAVGVFAPQHLGVIQFYGAAAEASTEYEAAQEALRRMAAVEATLANYPLSRLRTPDTARLQLLVQRIERLPRILAILGHPDPRQAKRGMGRDGSLGESDDDLASQQGEILLRGLAKLAEDFVFLVTAANIGRPLLADALVRMAQTASHYASRQRGSLSIGFSVALPLAAALSSSVSGQSGHATSTATSASDAVSEGWGQGETQSWGHSVGQSTSHGLAHTDSYAETDAVSHTTGTSHGVSTGHTDSRSDTNSFAHTDSQAHTDSSAHTVSHGVTHSESTGVTDSTGTSGSTSTGTSSGVSHSSGANWGSSQNTGNSSGVTVSQGAGHSASTGGSSSWSAGHSDGVASSTSESASHNWSEGESRSVSSAVSASSSSSHATSTAESDSTSQGSGWSAGVGQTASEGQSSGESLSHSNSAGGSASVSHGTSASLAESVSQGASTASNWSAGTSDSSTLGMSAGVNAGVSGDMGIVVADVGAHAGMNVGVSGSHTTGTNTAVGGGTSESSGTSSGVTIGANDSASSGASWGTSDGASVSSSHSAGLADTVSAGVSVSTGASHGVTSGVSDGVTTGSSLTLGSGASHSASSGGAVGASTSQSASSSDSVGVGSSTSHGTSDSTSSGLAVSSGASSGQGTSQGGSSGVSVSQGTSSAQSAGWSQGHSVSQSSGRAESWGTADTVGRADTLGSADTRGWAQSVGVAESTGTNRGWFESTSSSHAVTRGQADTESWTDSVSEAWSEGKALSTSYQQGRLHGTGEALGTALSYGGGRGFGGGLSAGLVPGFSVGRNWQTEDDVAIRLTELTRSLESLLNQASMEGGFLTTALLFVGEQGERAAAALAPQAFHGPAVPTPVLTVPADESLRLHALAFRPSLTPSPTPFGIDLLWSRWGTLLTPGMLAAYTAPNLFEEGTVLTIQEKLPPLAFYPESAGEVILGHQVSPETGDLTCVPLHLSRQRHFHTAFVGDTGYGKSVAAERMVYETTLHWRMRTIVLDFGAGWRKLLNAPGMEERVEIRQLSPGGVRPLRWNPLQVGAVILPEVQWRAFCDIFGAIAKLGVRRQVAELREALRRVYLRAGVLVDDPDCRQDAVWGRVRPGEEAMAAAAVGTPLGEIATEARQRLAVARSQAVGLAQLYSEVEEKLRTVPPRDSMLRGVLEGILFRLHPLVQGAAASQYAPGRDAVDINALAPADYGVAVLEGGAFLDDFSKAFLLGWAAWHLYTDAVLRRMQRARSDNAHIQIVFEEANKILAGLDNGGDEEASGVSTAEQFAAMWRDSRKYGIWLHLITQSPSLIPPGILSSCNNVFVGQVKNARDRDLVIAALHRSEKGFVDESWRRFLASLPVARAVAKLGYAFDRADLEPCYIQPLQLLAEEPTDAEIVARLGTGRTS